MYLTCVRDRINGPSGKIRERGNDYLFYALIDVIVDHYFSIMERLRDDIDNLELVLLKGGEDVDIRDILYFKNQIGSVRKAIYPLRDSLRPLKTEKNPLIDQSTQDIPG